VDAVIEAFKKDVDVTLIDERLDAEGAIARPHAHARVRRRDREHGSRGVEAMTDDHALLTARAWPPRA